ncbi:MAG: TonB-dependent receptor [bacterium]|nr:TonB-dependent receptor [bacterium]
MRTRALRREAPHALVLALLVGVASSSFSAAASRAADDPFRGIEEMIVFGEGGGQALSYDDVSIIEFDAEHIEAIGAADIADIAAFTPNLEIRTPFAASSPTLFIRGVGIRDFTASSSSSVAVYIDETYMNSPTGQLAQLFDTENIEVLRGPQATRYGRNASAGTVRIVTRKPTGTPGTNVSLTYGRFDQIDADVAVENVLVEDTLSMRSAAQWSVRRGTTKNRCADVDYIRPPSPRDINVETPEGLNNRLIFDVSRACYTAENTATFLSPPGAGWTRSRGGSVKEWVNDVRNWGARSILRLQLPLFDMDWQLNLHGGQNRGDARQFQLVGADQRLLDTVPRPAPDGRDIDEYFDPDTRVFAPDGTYPLVEDPYIGNPFEGDYDRVEKEKIDLFGSSLVGSATFGAYRVTSVTGYEWSKRDTKINFDASPTPALHIDLVNRAYQLSQEVRLDYDGNDGYAWQVGGMFLYDAIDAENFFPFGLIADATDQEFTFFTRHTSFWGDFEWSPSETFSLETGARFNYDEKEMNLVRRIVRVIPGTGEIVPKRFDRNSPRAGEPIPPTLATSAATAFGWAGRIVATWRPTPGFDVSLGYTRGWKGPHINSAVLNPGPEGAERGALSEPVDPEIVDSIEARLRARFLGDRVALSSAFFFYDYQDLQVIAVRNARGATPVPDLINANDADVLGFEMEADLRPLQGWAPPLVEDLWIRLTFSWLDAHYTDFVNTLSAQNVGDNLVERVTQEDFTGNRVVNSPEFAFVGFVAWPLSTRWGELVPRFDWSFKDSVFFSAANSYLVRQGSVWLMNLRLTYSMPGTGVEVAGWVENLTDQRYTEDVFNLARVRNAILHAVADPRTYGLTLTARF